MKPDLQRRIQRYGWDKAAPFYDSAWQRQLKSAQEQMLNTASLQPGEQVLDVACGTGLVTLPAAEAVGSGGGITGTDISEGMIENARILATNNGTKNAVFHRMDAEALDFPDNTFDVVLCALGLMYVPDPLQALREMHRVLNPGGRAVVLVWGERRNCGWADIFPIIDRRVASDVCPLFFQQGTGDTLKNNFRSAGFSRTTCRRFSGDLHFNTDEDACIAAFAGGPVALAYKKFDEKTRQEAHAEYLASIEAFRKDDGYHLPGEFVTGIGFKEQE